VISSGLRGEVNCLLDHEGTVAETARTGLGRLFGAFETLRDETFVGEDTDTVRDGLAGEEIDTVREALVGEETDADTAREAADALVGEDGVRTVSDRLAIVIGWRDGIGAFVGEGGFLPATYEEEAARIVLLSLTARVADFVFDTACETDLFMTGDADSFGISAFGETFPPCFDTLRKRFIGACAISPAGITAFLSLELAGAFVVVVALAFDFGFAFAALASSYS
jgi:hypothetical protein